MTMTLEQAAAHYLDMKNPPTGSLCDDLRTAGAFAAKWRKSGPEATATILHALQEHCGMTQRQIAEVTGISQSTVSDLINQLHAGKWAGASDE